MIEYPHIKPSSKAPKLLNISTAETFVLSLMFHFDKKHRQEVFDRFKKKMGNDAQKVAIKILKN